MDYEFTNVYGNMVKIVTWYDNEWGYSSRVGDLVKYVSRRSSAMRVPVIAGNWKMYKTAGEAGAFVRAFLPLVSGVRGVEIVLAPAYLSIGTVAQLRPGNRHRGGVPERPFRGRGGVHRGGVDPDAC